MMTEIEQLDYNDVLVSMGSILKYHGARKVLIDFQMNFPQEFQQLKQHIGQIGDKPIAILLRKP